MGGAYTQSSLRGRAAGKTKPHTDAGTRAPASATPGPGRAGLASPPPRGMRSWSEQQAGKPDKRSKCQVARAASGNDRPAPPPPPPPPQKKERKKSFDPIKGQVTLPSGAAPAGAGMARGGGRGEGDTTHERETDRQADRPTTVPPTRRELGKENKASPAPPARRRPPARAGRLSRGPASRPRPHDKD